MTISEFKLENHKPITEDVAESQPLFEHFTITDDAEYDVFLPLAEQKFKVTLK